ncbi:MAG TPA: response regulator, partial [Vicinamibacteria bacterium]|nr:response regulator [Vicinamibacteria bacterium]
MSRILVVDDDRSTRQLIRLQLRGAGFAVDMAEDGKKALARIRGKRPPDLVLLDVWMPGMDGLEVLAHLRGEPSQPKVVVMTADDTSETLLRAVREHAYRYVTKPVEPKALIALVREVLASTRDVRPIEVVSARPDWVELLVPCDREAAERIQDV